MPETRLSFCRVCINNCSIEVDVEDGVALEVRGNPTNPVYGGYSCIKGRAQTRFLRDPKRVIGPLKRGPDGTHHPIASALALDEIATRLSEIRDAHGPRAIASFAGTMALINTAPTSIPFHDALLDAIGTPMRFDPNTIDKGGKQTAQSFLGYWGAPSQGFDRPEAILLIGINPWMTITGFPSGSPKRWLTDTLAGGCRLIVIDPRKTNVARRADWHLQAAPGHDALILAAMVKVVLSEGLADGEFVARHVRGVDELTRALADLDIGEVANAADISMDDLVAATRCYAAARRGYAMAGTGPHMTGSGTLIEYLVLVLETLCSRWLREGEAIRATPCLLPTYAARAEARDPDDDWFLQEHVRVRGLRQSRAGMPTGALAEEILTPGEGQVRALISWGGNPAVTFPDQRLTDRALRSLDLFVQVDPWYTESARLADYVIAPTMPLEAASTTAFLDALSGRATGYGLGVSYAQYTPAITGRPPDSDLLEEWEFFYELMVRMGYPVEVRPFGHPPTTPKLALHHKPSTDEILELLTVTPRIPLETVKAAEGGTTYPDGLIIVEPGDPDARGRLDVGHPEMMRWLRDAMGSRRPAPDSDYPFRLLCRRNNHVYNTSSNTDYTHRDQRYNPAYVNPAEMAALSLEEGEQVVLASGPPPLWASCTRIPPCAAAWSLCRSATASCRIATTTLGSLEAARIVCSRLPRCSIPTPGSRA